MLRDPSCTECKLSETCKTRCMWGRWLDPDIGGSTHRRIMVVIDNPEKPDDHTGKPFADATSSKIQKLIYSQGIDPGQVYVTCLTRCHGNLSKKRKLTMAEIRKCQGYLKAEIAEVQPRIIMTMGVRASEMLACSTAKHRDRGIGRLLPDEYQPYDCEPIHVLPSYPPWMLRTQPWLSAEVKTDFLIAKQFIEVDVRLRPRWTQDDFHAWQADLYALCAQGHVYVAFDIETNADMPGPEHIHRAKDPTTAELWLLSLSHMGADAKGYKDVKNYLFTRHCIDEGTWSQIAFTLVALQANGSITLIAQRGDFDLMHLRHHLIGWDEVYLDHDTQLMHHLLNENTSHSLNALEWRYCPALVHKKGAVDLSVLRCEEQNQAQLNEYSIGDTLSTVILADIMIPKLEAQGLTPLAKMMARAASILADAERLGCRVDTARLNELLADAREKTLTLASQIQELCEGEGVSDFNTNSHPMCEYMLYHIFKFNEYRNEHDKVCADKNAINAILNESARGEHERLRPGGVAFAVFLRDWRKWNNIANTLESIKEKAVHLPGEGEDVFIRTQYSYAFVPTGRLSSSSPNLQNVPKRDEDGRRIREVFIPRDGYSFVDADNSQVEYRLGAEMSGDTEMIRIFKEGLDLHQESANLFDCPRDEAKNVNFADFYGGGPRLISSMPGVKATPDEIRDIQVKKRARFKELALWIRNIPLLARQNGGKVTGLFGRIRRVPYVATSMQWWRGRATRQLVNSPVQGSASDLTMLQMCLVQDFIDSSPQWRGCIRLVLTVHDSLMWEVPDKDAENFAACVKQIMEQPDFKAYEFNITLRVPLVTDVKILKERWDVVEAA